MKTEKLYSIGVDIIAFIHILIIFGNLISVVLLVAYEPFYIWLPLITFLVSPLVGGTYCMFNRLENYFRDKAGRERIYDRFGALFEPRK